MCICTGLSCSNFSEIRVSTLLATLYSNRRGFKSGAGYSVWLLSWFYSVRQGTQRTLHHRHPLIHYSLLFPPLDVMQSALPRSYWNFFCIYLRTNSVLCHLHHKLIGFYNRDEKCLLRGTDRGFKWSSLRFVFKRLNNLRTPLNHK